MATRAFDAKVRKLRGKSKAIAFAPEQIWIDKEVADHPQTIRILNKLKDVEVDIVDDVRKLKKSTDLTLAKKQMILTSHKGQAFKPCQGIGKGHFCCNYRVIDLISGCPMDCSYCILQSYLANNPVTTVYVNIENILSEVGAFLDSHKNKFYRIGTGELADSLALDHIVEFAHILIPFFASKRNALFELKTKSTFVDHLLDLKHRNRTVISWSLNTPQIIETDEINTASLDERLAAAKKVAAAGYGVGFHFDPMIIGNNPEAEMEEYLKVVDKIFDYVEPRQISWVSLGLLRYPSNLSSISTKRFENTKIFTGEMVPSDGKMRYLRFIREKAYKPLWNKLAEKLPIHKLYLCMETEAVWEKIDPTVKGNTCIQKRLFNTESIAFDYNS